MTRYFQIIFLILSIISCSNFDRQKSNDTENHKSTSKIFHKISNDSLRFFTYKTQPKKQGSSSLRLQNGLPIKWIGLSKNSVGLFIYHKRLGHYSELTIENNTMTNGGYGEPISWPIRQIEKISEQEFILYLGLDSINSTFAISKIQILRKDTLFAIQTTKVYEKSGIEKHLLRKYQEILIPEFQQHLFIHIDEPNKESPDGFIPLEEIDIEKFKKEKNWLQQNLIFRRFDGLPQGFYLSVIFGHSRQFSACKNRPLASI